MEAKHTPGPWRVSENQIQSEKINGYGNFILLEMPLRKEPQMQDMTEEDKANARLIAAAPELLEACKLAIPWLVRLGDFIGNGEDQDPMGRCNSILALKCAIAKATDAA